MASVVSMKQLLEAGVHFGHQTRRWNPKMAPYIFTERNGIYIIDLQKTVKKLEEAYNFVREISADGKSVLFVGTKKQAQDSVKEEALRAGAYYVNARWLGGMLTNFTTIKKSINRLKKIEKMEIDGTFESLTKKEVALLQKEKAKLDKNLAGIKEMKDLPGVIFIIDTKKEAIAVAEARKCHIPIVAIVDTNCNPEGIDFPIPGNDDAIRAITLFTSIIANAVVEADNEIGLQVIENIEGEEAPEAEGTPEKEEEEPTMEEVMGEKKSGKFTDEDYSNYVPEEKAEDKPEEEENKFGIDEDKFEDK